MYLQNCQSRAQHLIIIFQWFQTIRTELLYYHIFGRFKHHIQYHWNRFNNSFMMTHVMTIATGVVSVTNQPFCHSKGLYYVLISSIKLFLNQTFFAVYVIYNLINSTTYYKIDCESELLFPQRTNILKRTLIIVKEYVFEYCL